MPRSKLNVDEFVKGMLVEQLGCEASEITPNASLIDDLGADSLDTVEVVMSCEEQYEIEIPDEDADKLKTVGQLTDYLKGKGCK